MQTDPSSISIVLPPETALNLADALDVTVQFLELELDEAKADDATDPETGCIPGLSTEEQAVFCDDLKHQLGAARCTLQHLGRELPKHFPDLSRAARREKPDDEDGELYGEPGA